MSNKMLKENVKKTKWAPKTKGIFWVASITVFAVIFLSSISINDKISDTCLKANNNCIPLEVKDNPQERTKGLSDRDSIEGGMLFVFDKSAKECIWMRDMKFNIDIIWLDENKRVIKVMSDVSPSTFPESFCADNTKYVIELNSGVAKENSFEMDKQLNF